MKNWIDVSRKVQKMKWKGLAVVGVLGVLLAGCGSVKGYSYESAVDTAAPAEQRYDSGGSGGMLGDGVYSNAAVTEEAAEEYSSELAEFDEEIAEEGSGADASQTPEVQDTARKLIRNVNLEVETETFDDLLATVRGRTELVGGYIEESYTYNGSSYSGKRLRNASLTIRVPAEHLDEFLENVAEVSNVISRNESVTDVTLQYVDMESHKKVLLAEQERLLDLLTKAESIEDIITLEERLSEVRYQLESMESQLRVMDNQVSYSTVYLYINEVVKLTPVKEQGVWEKISTGFANSLYDVGNGFVDFGIGLLIDLPYIIVWVVFIALAIVVLKFILRRIKKRNLQRKESTISPIGQDKSGKGAKLRGGIFSKRSIKEKEEVSEEKMVSEEKK